MLYISFRHGSACLKSKEALDEYQYPSLKCMWGHHEEIILKVFVQLKNITIT